MNINIIITYIFMTFIIYIDIFFIANNLSSTCIHPIVHL